MLELHFCVQAILHEDAIHLFLPKPAVRLLLQLTLMLPISQLVHHDGHYRKGEFLTFYNHQDQENQV
ncbi:MAG: hypothetical protein RMY33_033710 [Nostoc sp. DedQUE03]